MEFSEALRIAIQELRSNMQSVEHRAKVWREYGENLAVGRSDAKYPFDYQENLKNAIAVLQARLDERSPSG